MSLKALVNTKDVWDEFIDEMESRIQQHYRSMANQVDMNAVSRHQGAIHELFRLKQLRDKLNAKT